MLGVLIFPNLEEGVRAPIVVNIDGIRQGVSELLQAVYIQSRKVSVAVLPQF